MTDASMVPALAELSPHLMVAERLPIGGLLSVVAKLATYPVIGVPCTPERAYTSRLVGAAYRGAEKPSPIASSGGAACLTNALEGMRIDMTPPAIALR